MILYVHKNNIMYNLRLQRGTIINIPVIRHEPTGHSGSPDINIHINTPGMLVNCLLEEAVDL